MPAQNQKMNHFMRIRRMNNKAQNFVEYTLILGIVGLALFSMQAYFKRGIQSVIKVTADDLGPQGQPLFRKFLDNPVKYQEKIDDQQKIEVATKARYYPDTEEGPGYKYNYSSTSSEDVTIKNKGQGNIVRTTNKGSVSSDDVSH